MEGCLVDVIFELNFFVESKKEIWVVLEDEYKRKL